MSFYYQNETKQFASAYELLFWAIWEYAKLIGEVIQVLEENGAYTLRVNITKGEYDIWTDTIMVYYVGDADNNRILEDDMVTMYGQLGGMYTYTTIMGGENTVPLLYAEYIDIN